MSATLLNLARQLEGEFYFDDTMRTLYATDASAYREMPLAVAVPKTVEDIKKLIAYARTEKLSLIPRTAGTSLAGQVVGKGIVVDVSKYFTSILELNKEERWVRVQPGVIRDELNLFLRPHGLLFGPETSTANRAMIGGMVGNNSCGSNSIVYRSTREHLLEVKALLSDGTEAVFHSLSPDAFHAKCDGTGLEAAVYRSVRQILGNYDNQVEIRAQFPKASVERRNTGYALDLMLDTAPFTAGMPDFNFCTLLAGSEGTLAFITEIKLDCSPLPPPESGLLCVHFNTIDESLRANLIALQYGPSASELIDHYILECTKDNIEQRKNRFFVQGDPGAILVVEFSRHSREEIKAVAAKVEADMRAAGLGYHFPLLFGEDTKKIWTLRKAGLGLLSNLPGDEKAVPVIEDTAVDVRDLPAYIREFNEILQKHNLYSVHYAHAGSGEIHLRPIINLKTAEGNRLFRTIAEEIATLVKKYKGSLSGEHGDGRLRGEFIPQMVGHRNYELMRDLKRSWDPDGIFNPGKIVDTPSMNSMLRYEPGQRTPAFPTVFRFHRQDILQHAEQCNGSGDCRKTHLSGGTMCPSFMATRNEKDTTRARANILREFLTHSDKANRYDHKEIYEVMDLCLSCKGCKSECPSNVDVAKLKAEFLQHYYDANGVPFRSRLIANFAASARLGSLAPGLYNRVVKGRLTGRWIKQISGFALDRSMPLLHKTTLKAWYKKHTRAASAAKGRVYLFCDEFTNYNDTDIGIKTILLLEKLGYEVVIPDHGESGRAWLSKGLVRHAKKIAASNVRLLSPLITEETPLIGIEPSAILTFRDEYPDLADDDWLAAAQKLAANSFLVDDFLAREIDKGNITSGQFISDTRQIQLHGHCQQKALTTVAGSVKLLSLPQNYSVKVIPSGCCGMAGSFGYEKEHYDLSQKIGELVLLPTVRRQPEDVIIAAPGTSCRHQIKDGTGRKALHPVEVLYNALL
ncbi:FAD-linked oxidase C-terminal domain-containing protein [Flavitalea sp. BT771]|uniref:FAD-binding and (Fe-S)-binding domain-containing protein n=1 Tax=Flavitalea sp. BT771 TaxID=3063329 RepID=UPI0026E3DBCC|nr:FAD-binding and (Fe-S)-binding domain-containing protein [Flavitalea sp. BT771]MDO6430599.1 FAD-linked oxidase C-terminal domain-containing protein [Flavitalea sp. BT771]MDV6219261.1 FAD-linked oxidase C-terminal domain-containing protein [Flavitalea sp. BT771]